MHRIPLLLELEVSPKVIAVCEIAEGHLDECKPQAANRALDAVHPFLPYPHRACTAAY